VSDCYAKKVGTEINVYEEECCLEPGQYTLTCLEKEDGDGWKTGSSVVIQGETYCDDFTDGSEMSVDIAITETSYYVDDGCHSENVTPDDVTGFYQTETSEAFVRCCSDDASSCTTVNDCTNSNNLMSYAGAEDECTAIGMRLCTKDELLTDVCCGAGGQCDSAAVWTSTQYVEELYYIDDGCHTDTNTPDDFIGYYEGEFTKAGVRCCSSDGTSCTTPSTCTSWNDLKNHVDAEAECAADGMRLCTKDELLSEICCTTGGGCDSELVWTSTIYVEGAENAYYVDDGCHSENSTPDDYVGFYQSEYSEAYVRCCSDDGSSCTTVNNCNNADNLMNYVDAEAECLDRGKRLCTMDELLSDMCCGAGGGCDSELVWTSTLSTDE